MYTLTLFARALLRTHTFILTLVTLALERQKSLGVSLHFILRLRLKTKQDLRGTNKLF